MSDIKDQRYFWGGIDSDSDFRNVMPEDYISAHNIVSGLSKIGGVTNFKGNTLVPYSLPTGNNTCIGTLRNIKENSIIYWVYNDQGNHSILEYYCDTNSILPILEPDAALGFTTDFLGFTLDHKIHSANIINDLLFWTDNNVSPRQINKKSARAFLNQTPPSADVFPYDNLIATSLVEAYKTQFLETIKYKPESQPLIDLRYDPTRKTNYLREKMVQVRYRYIYLDNEPSRWSDGSYVSLPTGVENINGPDYNMIANNYLRVFVNTGHPNVKEIELAFRFGNTEAWGRLDTPIRKYDNDNQRLLSDFTVVTYDFYNDSVLIIQPDEIDNYDAVPLKSKTQEIVDNNILVYANNEEGYENPDLDASITYYNELTDMGEPELDDFKYVLDTTNYLLIPMNKGELTVGCTLTFFANYFAPVSDFYISYAFQEDDFINWPYNFQESLYQMMVNSLVPPVSPSTVNKVASYNYLGTDYAAITIDNASIDDLTVLTPFKKIPSWKKGAWHPFGIVYKDIQGRDGGVLTGQSLALYNPYLPEIFPLTSLDNQFAYKSQARITINHQPPIWAHTYEIVYATNDLLKYTQFAVKDNPTQDVNGNYNIKCDYIIDYINDVRVDGSLDFQFETGDKLRFIANTDNYCSMYVEAKVLAFDTSTNVLTVSAYSSSQITAGMGTPTQEGTLVELFQNKTLATQEDRPYFAIGETYSVLNAGTATRAHQGNLVNQNTTLGIPAQLSLNRGDCYIYRRYFDDNTLETMVESENFSDVYASRNIDISSLYVVIPNNRTRRYEQGLRHSGRYFPNTNVNNICRFGGSDTDTLNTMYGPINRIMAIGYTLKCLQTKKNTSIYIDRNMIFNADGTYQLATTDKVFGNKNPSELDYGCMHPESVVADDRQMYFFDVNTGSFIQDSANGMIPISDYKARTFFRDISNLIKNNPDIYVYSGVDNANDYINVTFIDTGLVPAIEDTTIVYQPSSNRWKTFTDYLPEYYGSNALVIAMFKDGQLWTGNTNAIRNSFFGVTYPSKVKTVSNMDFAKIKVFLAVAIYSNKTWFSPNDGDINVLPSVTYPQGMTSRLLESKFRWKEGVSYSEYMRDLLTPNTTNPIINGRKLRGECLVQEIRNEDTDEVILYSVIVHSTPSEMSK
jgi:hypothetical protein